MAKNKQPNDDFWDNLQSEIAAEAAKDQYSQNEMLNQLSQIDKDSAGFVVQSIKDNVLSSRIQYLLDEVINKTLYGLKTSQIVEYADGVKIRIHYYKRSDNTRIKNDVDNLRVLLQSTGEELQISPITITEGESKYIDIMIPSNGQTRIEKYIDATKRLSVGKQRLDISDLRNMYENLDTHSLNDSTRNRGLHNKNIPQIQGDETVYNETHGEFYRYQRKFDKIFDEAIEAVGRVTQEATSRHTANEKTRRAERNNPSTPGV